MQNICPQCGAPAEAFEPEVTLYTCPFCSAAYAVHHPQREQLLRAKFQKEQEDQRVREREQREKEKREREKEKKSSDRAGAIIPILVVGSILGLTGGIIYYEQYIAPGRWDGHSSFNCSKGKFTFTDVQATSDLGARGTCEIILIRPAFEASVKASEHAVVTITDGRIHHSSDAIQATGFAKVTINGTTIDGRVSSKGSAVVESKNAKINGKVMSDGPMNLVGFPATELSSTPASAFGKTLATAATVRKKDPGSKACTGITGCYKTFTGQVQGHLVIAIDADGKPGNVTYTGTATPDQKKCLIELGKQKSFVGEELPGAGQLVCDYAGTVTRGTAMMSQSGGFTPAPK